MRLIDADTVVHWESYDDEYETVLDHTGTIADFLDTMTDEGCPEIVDDFQGKLWKWNLCSKEMPQKDERYIVTVRDIFDNIKVQFRYWNADCKLWSGDQMDEVLAWCEIPEPWEDEKAEGAATP